MHRLYPRYVQYHAQCIHMSALRYYMQLNTKHLRPFSLITDSDVHLRTYTYRLLDIIITYT